MDNIESIDTSILHISPHLIDFNINPKALINAHNFRNLEVLVDEVRCIDNNKETLVSIVNEPLFTNAFNPVVFYEGSRQLKL